MLLRTTCVSALLLLVPTMGCTPDELPADDYPPLAGATTLEDLDPQYDVAEYALTVDVTSAELVEDASTEVWAYNGMSPGPVLQARVGDLVRVHVTNNLPQPTTVHWQGMRVTDDMDGSTVMGVYGIASGETFTYEFVARDAGTFWYHPGVLPELQVEAGLYGAFVVHEAEELRPDVDADRVLIFDDVLLDEDDQVAPQDMEHHVQMHGRAGNVLLVNGRTEERTIDLAPGAVERWRIVNTANARSMTFRFEGLEVREIGSDAGLWRQSWSRDIDELFLPVGRAELEVRLDDDEDSGAMQNVVLVLNNFGNVVEEEVGMVPVRLDEDAEPSSRAGHTSDPSYALPDADEDSDIDHSMTLGPAQDEYGQATWEIDGNTWPDYDEWRVDAGELEVIELRNLFGMGYPVHFHGQLFTIISRDGEEVDEPGLRDTVWLNGGEDVVIATDFDNPGFWLYRGSIFEYAALGMVGLVEVRE